MERDFMGLNSKVSVVVKEELPDGGCLDSGFGRKSGISWPLSNKVPVVPQFMSLKCEQDEKLSKNGHSGPTHPVHDAEMNPFSMMSPFLKAPSLGASQKFAGATMKQQFHGGNPHTAPPPPAASITGTTELWTNSHASGVPAQLTIFYGGTVNVFDDISLEKAHAIMLLARNTCTQSKLHMQAPATKHPAADQPLMNQFMNAPPWLSLPSPMSVSSHPVDRSGANSDDFNPSMSANLVNKAQPPRVMPPMGSVAASVIILSGAHNITNFLLHAAVPQARKASLARFLEKRKERVLMSAAPYYKLSSSKAADFATPDSTSSSLLCVTRDAH